MSHPIDEMLRLSDLQDKREKEELASARALLKEAEGALGAVASAMTHEVRQRTAGTNRFTTTELLAAGTAARAALAKIRGAK